MNQATAGFHESGGRAREHGPRDPLDAGEPRELSILVVDDDDGCRAGIAAILSDEGHRTYLASRGYEALERAEMLRKENKLLHLSILDFNMPDLTGVETFRQLVEMFPLLDAVFVSGDPSRTLEDEVRQAGGRVFMRKPLDVGRVRLAVQRLHVIEGFQVL